MNRYRIKFEQPRTVTISVEAEDEQQAKENASAEYGDFGEMIYGEVKIVDVRLLERDCG